MKKTKTKLKILSIAILTIFSIAYFESNVSAAGHGGATVLWNASTDDVGIGGYRVYYATAVINCTNWENGDQTARKADGNPGTLLNAPYVNVTGSTTLKYSFGSTTTLNPSSTYNFVVVAYDTSGNLSDCATTSGNAKFVSKAVTYSADFSLDSHVGMADYNILKANFGTMSGANPATGDADGTGSVNIFDYNILKSDFGY